MEIAENDIIFKRWGFVDSINPNSEPYLQKLEIAMAEFYNQQAIIQDYWIIAQSGNEQWKPQTHPYHCHLERLVEQQSTVIDFGCGSAHPIENLKHKNIQYIGIEWSSKQVEINSHKYPESNFICGNITSDHGLDEKADWAVSFFALEHCVRPHILLKRMFDSIKPAGKLALICPNFIQGMNSIRSGWRATSKKSKLRNSHYLDALLSYYQEKFVIPKQVHQIHQSSMKFPVYLYPRCLEAPYYSDNDAVYLSNEDKVADYFIQLGGEVLYSSKFLNQNIEDKESNMQEGNTLYLVIQKN